jgi:hypothetical protein
MMPTKSKPIDKARVEAKLGKLAKAAPKKGT